MVKELLKPAYGLICLTYRKASLCLNAVFSLIIMYMRLVAHSLSVGAGLVLFRSRRVQLSESDTLYFNLICLAKRSCFSVKGSHQPTLVGTPVHTSPACITTVRAEGGMREANHSFHFIF